ncbi:unnamed protein product [Didymodactylos carnosus]|uniref:Reverse transcriptase domain-containing protein n=1 Tax=Didymodactylos carnosus TaxID=1234261 RepID=A0A8S2F7V9_9BILA|nr:unnamed protein product [Didymodactylos carnosus]CAF4167498.1 unnamed protein product [Didymodactylos carnosus]
MLREATPVISQIVTDLFNESLINKVFPDCWELGQVLPLFKADDPQICSNYRPITLLPAFKAFDRVSHAGLLMKLRNKGISDSMVKWLESYLTNRNIVTIVDGATSDPLKVTCGVPQGSVLGPLLFLLYIDDLPLALSASCKMFADDVSLYTKTLELEIDQLKKYLGQNVKSSGPPETSV